MFKKKRTKSLVYKLNKFFGIYLSNFVENTVWVLIKQFVSFITGVLISIIFTHFSTKTIYGQYSFFMSIFSLMTIFSIPGLSSIIYRSAIINKDKTYLLAIYYSIKKGIYGSVVIVLLGLFYLLNNQTTLGMVILLSSLIFPFYYPSSLWNSYLQAKEYFYDSAKYNIAVSIINFVVILATIYFKSENIFLIIFSSITSTTLINLIITLKTKKFIQNDKVDSNWKSSGIKMSLPVIFTQFYVYADKIILMFFMGEEKLAIYSIAVIPALSITNILGSVIRVIIPQVYKIPTDKLICEFKKKAVFYLIINFIFIFIVGLILEIVIPVLYTKSYSDSILPAQIYLLIIPFYIATSILGNILLKERKENFFSFTVIFSGIINLASYFILIPYVGLMGGVIGSVLYFAIQSLLRLYYIMKNYSVKNCNELIQH